MRGQPDERAEVAGNAGRIVIDEEVRTTGDELHSQVGCVLGWDVESVAR